MRIATYNVNFIRKRLCEMPHRCGHAPIGGNSCANRIRQQFQRHGFPADVATSFGCRLIARFDNFRT